MPALFNLCASLESIPIGRGVDEEEERANILRRKQALDSFSCLEKMSYAKLIRDHMGSYSMVHVVMQHLFRDQLMRLNEIEKQKGKSLFTAIFKHHKRCFEEGLQERGAIQNSKKLKENEYRIEIQDSDIVEISKSCEARSAEIRRLYGKWVEEITEEQRAPGPAPSSSCNFCLADIGDSDLLSHIHCTAVLCRECLDSSLKASPDECLVCFKRCTPSEWVQVEEKKTGVKKSRRRKNKKKSKKEPALGNASETVVPRPNKESCEEKVKVKAELRSKISELELAKEAVKLKISSSVGEEDATSSALESKIKIALEKKDHLRAKLEDIDSAIQRLLEEKRSVEKEQEEVEKEVAVMEKKKEVSKEASALAIKHQTEKLEKVQKELGNIRKELDLAEGRVEVNNNLEKFMTRQIKDLEEELVCPVCLEVTTKAPIYKCSDDHLICRY